MKPFSLLGKESGQLMMPILALLFMFGIFLASYVQWCRHKYWVVRMDIAAQATALSATRTQAELLNTLAAYQLAENLFVQKATIAGKDISVVEDYAAGAFLAWNGLLKLIYYQIRPRVLTAAYIVAHDNGADGVPIAKSGDIVPDLQWQALHITYLYIAIPDGHEDFSEGYLARGWGPGSRVAQPDPKKAVTWWVCRANGVCDYASARLWLDVDNNAPLVNGGFPRVNDTILGGLGIQCFYPQFNARLITRTNLKPRRFP